MSSSEAPASPVTQDLISTLIHKMALVVPPQLSEIMNMIPDEHQESAHLALVLAAATEAESGLHAGMLALVSGGLQEDGSVHLTPGDTAAMVRTAIEYLIANNVK